MMEINLDTTRQKDLYEKACRDMADKIPGWTDEFPSDPAVAVLEHLSYLSDIQNYVLNRVTDRHYLAYCRLLGISPRQLTPAQILALPDPAVPCLRGERFYIGDMPFEVMRTRRAGLPQISQVALEVGNSTHVWQTDRVLALEGTLPCRLTLRLSGMLPAQKTYRFWVSIAPEAGRNAPAKTTTPPVTISAQIWMREQWQAVPCTDQTCGFLQSGFLLITPTEATDTVAFCIHGAWEGVPQLRGVVLEPVALMQQHTRSACMDLTAPFLLPEIWRRKWMLFYFTPCGTGWRQERYTLDSNGQITGWGDQKPEVIRVVAAELGFHALHRVQGVAMEELMLEDAGILPDTLRVMMEEDGIWYDCPVRLPEAGKTLMRGCRWELARQTIRFGDGRDYLPPSPGQALISGCVRTAGSAANGARGVLTSSADAELAVLVVASGGQDAEPPKEAFARAAREQEQPLRAVTCEDYERLAQRTPGLALEQVQAIPKKLLGGTGPGVVLLAKPRAHCAQPTLSPWQQKQISAFLEPYRLLGVPLEIRGPRYCPVRVHAVLQTDEPVPPDKLRGVLLPLTDGVDGTLDFGAEISYTAIYAALCSIGGVRSVRKLELTPLVRGVACAADGSIRPAPDMLPCLDKLDVSQSQ